MTLLRILKNLAVLIVLTVSGLSMNPRPMAAQLSCRKFGQFCYLSVQCCSRLYCQNFPKFNFGRCVY